VAAASTLFLQATIFWSFLTMAFAKLSQSAAASLQFVKRLHSVETHALVKREVFAQAKTIFGIPADHRVKCELDPDSPNYLELIRKKDGSKYELNGDNKWVGTEADVVLAKSAYVVVSLESLQAWAAEQADNGESLDVVDSEYVEIDGVGANKPVQLKADDRYVYIKVDRASISED